MLVSSLKLMLKRNLSRNGQGSYGNSAECCSLSRGLSREELRVLCTYMCYAVLVNFFNVVFGRGLIVGVVTVSIVDAKMMTLFILMTTEAKVCAPVLSRIPGIDCTSPIPRTIVLATVIVNFSVRTLVLMKIVGLSQSGPALRTHIVRGKCRW